MNLNREVLDMYPDVLNKEQLCKIAHMSKRTALFLLQSKLLPSVSTGKQTRCYKIRKKDVIDFFDELESSPHKVITPPKWYSSSSPVKLSPYVVRSIPNKLDEEFLRNFYERDLSKYSDILTVAEVIDYTGYRHSTITEWIRQGKLVALEVGRRYIIPKVTLIDWLCSDAYNRIDRKTKKHVYSLWWSIESGQKRTKN